MRSRPFLLLIAGFVLVLMAAGEADAEKDPEWSYETGGYVESAISADGEYIAVGVDAGFGESKVYLFDKDSSTPLWSYTTGGLVHSVAISADGEYVVAGTGYNEDKVYLFDKDSSTPIWSYDTGDWVYSVAISADGEYIVSGGASETVYLFNKDSSTPLWSYETGGGVNAVAIAADGEYIAAGSRDDKVYLFDKDSSTPLWSHTTGDYVWSVAISADGEYIAAGSWDYKVYLFDKDSSTPLWSHTTGNYVWSVAISADGEYIAAGSNDNKVYLFEKDSGAQLWSYTTGDYVESVAISANGEYIAAGSEDNTVHLSDKDSSTPLWNYTTGGEVLSVSISADGEYIAAGTGDDDYKVYLFEDKRVPDLAINGEDITYEPQNPDEDNDIIVNVTVHNYGDAEATEWRVILYDGDPDNCGGCKIDEYTSQEGEGIPSGENITVQMTWYGVQTDPGYHELYALVEDAQHPSQETRLDNNKNYTTILIEAIQNDAPVAIATLEKYFVWPGESVRVDARASWDNETTTGMADSDDGYTNLSYRYYAEGWTSWRYDWYEDVVFANPGEKEILVQVRDERNKESQVLTLTVMVKGSNDNPVAVIDSITPSSAWIGEAVTFLGSGSDTDGTVEKYQWSSSIDGNLSTEKDFSTSNLSAGYHTILFQVQDNDGAWAEDTAELFVVPNSLPVTLIESIEPSPAEKGSIVFFNGTGSDTDGTIAVYQWVSSIDGELSDKESFSTQNLSLGLHTITFRAKDNNETWGETSASLLVFAYPIAIAGQDSTGTPGVPLQFSGAGTDEDGTIAKYEWDFDGDGVFEWSSTENGLNTYIYNNEDTYTATLRVTDNDGFTDTDTVEVTISEKKIQIDDEGNVTVTPAGEDEEGIPAPSLAASVVAVAAIALRRRR